MISESLKTLEREIGSLSTAVCLGRLPEDFELEICKLVFLLQQRRERQLAIYHNHLAVCARAGLEPTMERPCG